MDNILIPGLWLDGSSWDKVVPVLEQAGHRTHPITLPGMESQDADRSRITLRDHVDAVIATIDSIDRADGKAVLVGYSAGAAIAHAALDARPDRVARVVYVGGFPTGDGVAVADGYPVENGEVPLSDWSTFEEEDLDAKLRAEFRERAIPSPATHSSSPTNAATTCPSPSSRPSSQARCSKTGSSKISNPCGNSRRSTTSTTLTFPRATGRSSPGPRNLGVRSWTQQWPRR